MSVAENILQLKNDFDGVYSKGIEDGQTAFVNNYIDSKNGEFTNAFYRWTDEYYKPTKAIEANVLASTYGYSTITDTLVDITYTGNNLGAAFYMANRMLTIRNLILTQDTAIAATAFSNCSALINLTISGQGKIISNVSFKDCTNLSDESIKSIVDALSDNTTGLSVTFKKAAVNKAFGINVDDETTWGEGSDYRKLTQKKPKWSFNHVV